MRSQIGSSGSNDTLSFVDLFINATSRAAYGASLYKGKNDKMAADKAAVDEMRNELNKIEMDGKIYLVDIDYYY